MRDFENVDAKLDQIDSGDFDIDGVGEGYDTRKPDLSLFEKIKHNVTKDIKERTSVKDVAKATTDMFPDILGSDASRGIKALESTFMKDIKSYKQELAESSDELLNFLEGKTSEGSLLNKAVHGVKNALASGSTAAASNPSDMDKAKADMEATFGKNQLELGSLDILKKTAHATATSNKANVKMANAQLELSKYGTALQERYYKKSIELKYRQLIETKRATAEHKKTSALVLESLVSISHNTALPDAVKLRSSEVFKKQVKEKLSRDLYDSLGLKNNFATNIAKNLNKKMSSLKDAIISPLSAANDMTGGMNMMSGMIDDDMLAQMSPEERAELSKTGMITKIGTGFVVDSLKGKAAKFIRDKVAKSKRFASITNASQRFTSDPSRFLDELESKTENGLLSRVYGFLGDITHNSEKAVGKNVKRTPGDVDDIAEFDVRTYNSINSSIPGLLAKILREVTVISTGNSDVEELHFDNVKGTFSSPSSITKTLKAELTNEHSKYTKESIFNRIKNMERRAGIKLTAKEREIFTKELLKNGSDLNTDYIDADVANGLFSNLDGNLSMKFTSLVKNSGSVNRIDKDGKEIFDTTRQLDTNNDLAYIYQHNLDMTRRIENLIKDGFGEQLEMAGFVTYDPIMSEYSINIKALAGLNADAIMDASKRNDPVKVKTKDDIRSDEKAKIDKKRQEATSKKVKVNMDVLKRKVSELVPLTTRKALTSHIKSTMKYLTEAELDDLIKYVENTYNDTKKMYENLEIDTVKEKIGTIKDKSARTYKNTDIKDKIYINIETLKAKASKTFGDITKEEALKNVRKISKVIGEENTTKLETFVRENYDKANKVYSTIENDLTNAIKDGEIKDIKALDKKHNGKNFFQKMASAFTDALSDSKKKKSTFDKDGDGYRDGSWRDILSFGKNKKNDKEIIEKGIKDPKKGFKMPGILGILGMALPMIAGAAGTLLTSLFGGVMSGFSNLRHLAKLGPLLNIMKGGFLGLGTGIMRSAGMITSAVEGSALLANGLWGKLKSAGKFIGRHKGKLMLGAGLAALFGSSHYGEDDSSQDGKSLASSISGMFDFDGGKSVYDSVQREQDRYTKEEERVQKESGISLSGAGLGIYAAGAAAHATMKSKRAKVIQTHLKDAKSSLSKVATKAETSMTKMVGGKMLGKVIPGVNIVGGAMNVYDDIESGDYSKAALHTLSTALSLIPLLGVPLSIGADLLIDNYGKNEVSYDQKSARDAVVEQTRRSYHGRSGHSGVITGETEMTPAHARNKHKGTVTSAVETAKANGEIGREAARRHGAPIEIKPSSKVSAGDRILLEEIAAHESKRGMAGYYMVYSGFKGHHSDITKMSLGAIMSLQSRMVRETKGATSSSAVGKYQMISKTLKEIRIGMSLPLNTVFSPDIQDQMILYRLNGLRGYKLWKEGQLTDSEFLDNLSKEFASLPYRTGSSYYDNVNGNKSLTSREHMMSVLRKVRSALGMPASSMVQDSDEEIYGANTSKDNSSTGLVRGVKAAIEAAMKFFGLEDTNTYNEEDGDSSTNKPISGQATVNQSILLSGNADKKSKQYIMNPKATGNASLCGLKVTKLPPIPKAIHVAKNRKFANGKPKNLIIHNTAGSTFNLDRMRRDGFGTQLWIDKDGSIYQVGEIDQVLYHVGKTKNRRSNVTSVNSIGIEMVCEYRPNLQSWAPYTAAQAKSLQMLSACIRKTFGIPEERIYYHEQISPKTKDEGKEGAEIAKTGSIRDVTPEVLDTTSNNPIIESSMNTAFVLDQNSNASYDHQDGDSSTNRPVSEYTVPTRSPVLMSKAKVVTQSDTVVEKIVESSNKGLAILTSMDSSLTALVDLNTKMLSSMTNKSVESKKVVAAKIPIDKKPAINLKQ